METHEILDRLELLYPKSSFLSDLRKALVSEDQYALFRIIQGKKDTAIIEALRKLKNNDVFDKDCISRGQIQSKLWLIKELQKIDYDLGVVFLCAGWYCTLATMLFESKIKVDKIRSFDIDESCINIAETFNKPWVIDNWKFKAIKQDIMDINYDTHVWQSWSNKNNTMSKPITDSPDTIINTSCEHIHNFDKWYEKIPNGKLVILQINDFFELEEHVNCVKNLKEFENISPFSKLLYEGELQLEKYKRFMRIGIK